MDMNNLNINVKTSHDLHLLYDILKNATPHYVMMFPWAPDATGVEYGIVIKIFEDENNYYAIEYRIYYTMDDYEVRTTTYIVPKSSITLDCFRNLILFAVIDDYGINGLIPAVQILKYIEINPVGPDNGISLAILDEMERYAGKHLENNDYIQLLLALDCFAYSLKPYITIKRYPSGIMSLHVRLLCRDIENIAISTGINKFFHTVKN